MVFLCGKHQNHQCLCLNSIINNMIFSPSFLKYWASMHNNQQAAFRPSPRATVYISVTLNKGPTTVCVVFHLWEEGVKPNRFWPCHWAKQQIVGETNRKTRDWNETRHILEIMIIKCEIADILLFTGTYLLKDSKMLTNDCAPDWLVGCWQ